ncbi:MAG: hypothetical protein ACREJ3_06065, partial [Polyangiaceae bacterium]
MRREDFPIATVIGVSCLAAGGCTSLLGDFTSNPNAPDAGSTAGGDAASHDAMTPPDGARSNDAAGTLAADGGSPPLACTSWRYASPVVLETLSGGDRRAGANLAVFAASRNQVRVIAGKPSAGVAFSVYTVDESQTTPHVTQLDAPRGAGQLAT